MTDSQKRRVYRAERVAFPQYMFTPQWKAHEMSLVTCQELVTKIWASRWCCAQFPRVKLYAAPAVECRPYSRCATGSTRFINLPQWSRTKFVVLHELAHAIMGSGHGHGRLWARAFVMLVDRWMSLQDGKVLRQAFKAQRVKFSRPKELSPEALAALRARVPLLRVARAKEKVEFP